MGGSRKTAPCLRQAARGRTIGRTGGRAGYAFPYLVELQPPRRPVPRDRRSNKAEGTDMRRRQKESGPMTGLVVEGWTIGKNLDGGGNGAVYAASRDGV